MITRIGTLLLMIVFAPTSAMFALGTSWDRWLNLEEYGNSEVWEQRPGGILWKVTLMCKSVPNENAYQAWFQITVSKDKTFLKFLPPTLPPENRRNVPDSSESNDELDGVRLSEPPEESTQISYRFDEEKFKVDTFEFITDIENSGKTIAFKEIDRDELSELITEIETAESFEFDIDGEESTAVTIPLRSLRKP